MFRGSFFEGVPKFHIILSPLWGVLRYLVKRTDYVQGFLL